MKRRQGFTLVELLVVVAIISLLLSILLPAMDKARAIARSTLCQTRYRQNLIGFKMYAQEHNDYIPPPRVNFDEFTWEGQTRTDVNIWWYSVKYIGQYIGNDLITASKFSKKSATEIVFCPELKEDIEENQGNNGIGLNYIWDNKLHEDKGGPNPLAKVEAPARMVLLTGVRHGDSQKGAYQWVKQTYDNNGFPLDVNGKEWTNKDGVNAYRHAGLNICGFLDGHVDTFTNYVEAEKNNRVTHSAF